MQEGIWSPIAGSVGQRIADVTPQPPQRSDLAAAEHDSGITNAWCGMSVDQQRGLLILPANGGHGDYPGNEVYICNLRAQTPIWRRATDPTPNNLRGNILNNPTWNYADGRPRAMHNTYQAYGDGRVWIPFMNSVASGAGGGANRQISLKVDDLLAAYPASTAPYSYNPWDDHGDGPPPLSGTVKFGQSVFDPYTHRVYGLGSDLSYNSPTWWYVPTVGPNKGKVAGYTQTSGSFGNWSSWAVCAYDLRIIVVACFGSGVGFPPSINVIDIAANTAQKISNVTGTPCLDYGSGGFYVAKNRTIGIGNPRVHGSRIFRLQIPTQVVNGRVKYAPSGQWVWTSFVPGGATLTFDAADWPYSKFNGVANMGDGRSALVYIGGITDPIYVYKIPAGGL